MLAVTQICFKNEISRCLLSLRGRVEFKKTIGLSSFELRIWSDGLSPSCRCCKWNNKEVSWPSPQSKSPSEPETKRKPPHCCRGFVLVPRNTPVVLFLVSDVLRTHHWRSSKNWWLRYRDFKKGSLFDVIFPECTIQIKAFFCRRDPWVLRGHIPTPLSLCFSLQQGENLVK